MPSLKPIRVIDISKELNLATSTIIDFLEQKSYPVERLHHTPLLAEILNEINTEFGTGRSITILTQLTDKAGEWEAKNHEAANSIKKKWRDRTKRMELKRERSRRVIEGRERSRLARESAAERARKFDSVMKSVVDYSEKIDGKLGVKFLEMEIIRKALALNSEKKAGFIRFLKKSQTPL